MPLDHFSQDDSSASQKHAESYDSLLEEALAAIGQKCYGLTTLCSRPSTSEPDFSEVDSLPGSMCSR